MTRATHNTANAATLSRAQGWLLGQLAEDALGSLVEFQTPERIRQGYPDGVHDLTDGGTWNTVGWTERAERAESNPTGH